MPRSMKYCMLLVLAWIHMHAFSQPAKMDYTGSLEVALVNGGFESNAAVNLSQGLRFNNTAVSLGAGIDYYRFRSIPVFIDVKKYFSIGKVQPFVQAAAGLNTAWPTNEQKMVRRWWSWWPENDTAIFSNGFYSRAVAGVVLNPNKPVKINIVGGWTYKSVTASQNDLVFTGTGNRWETRTTNFALHRLYLGLGVSF